MVRRHTTKVAILVALAAALAACSKQEEQPVPVPNSSSAPEFRMGNGQRVVTLADCDQVPDPQPADDSGAGRATAVNQGTAARMACKRAITAQNEPNTDLARIREIKEKEQADQTERKVSEKEWGKRLNEGANKPVKEYKY